MHARQFVFLGVSVIVAACSSSSEGTSDSGTGVGAGGSNGVTAAGGSAHSAAGSGTAGGQASSSKGGSAGGSFVGAGGSSSTGGTGTAGSGTFGKGGSGGSGTAGKGGGSAGAGGSIGKGGGNSAGTSSSAGGSAGAGGSSALAGAGGSTAGSGGGGGAGGTSGAAGASGAAGMSGAAGSGGSVDLCAGLDMSTPVTLYQSADDSNSMASPAIIRREILRGDPVQPALVRSYEFLNYYRFDYQPAEPGHVRVVPEMRADAMGAFHLQVAIQSPLAEVPRRPMSLTLVLDTSGSMGMDGRIERERAVLAAIVAQLTVGDTVSLLSWSDEDAVMLDSYPVTGPNDPMLLAQVKALQTNGGTNLDLGLKQGYELALKNYVKEKMNRVLMISDGEANVGVTNADTIGMASHSGDEEGIYLVGVNVGAEAGDHLMNIVTDKGRGASVFIDTEAEAAKMFGARFDETMDIAARAVRLELTVPWYLKLHSFSGEQSSTDAKAVDPQHLAPNDAMVFNETFDACSPTVVMTSDVIKARATWQTPLTHLDQADEVSFTLDALLAAPAPHLAKGTAIFDYAQMLRQIGSVPTATTKAAIATVAKEVKDANPGGDADLEEIAMLLQKLDASL